MGIFFSALPDKGKLSDGTQIASRFDISERIGAYLNKSRLLEYCISLYENHRLAFIAVYLVAIFAAVLYLTWRTPLVADDFWKAESAFSIHSLGDFMAICRHFYMSWGGRIWGEALTWLFLLMPKNIFNVLNSFAYVALVLLLYFNALGRFRLSLGLLVAVNFALLACLPAFGQNILWLNGSANYMWMSLFPLSLLAAFRFYYEGQCKKFNHPVSLFVFFFMGICAGWGIELLSVGLVAVCVGYIVIYREKYGVVPLFSKVSLTGVFVGAALLWLAPGNFVRAAVEHFSPHISTKILRVIRNVLVMGWLDSNLLLCMAFGILCFVVVSSRKTLALIYVVGAMASAASLGVVEPMKTRTYFVPVIFMVAAAGIMYTEMSNEPTTQKIGIATLRKLKAFILIFLVAGSIGLFWEAREGVVDYLYQWRETLAIIEEQKAVGNLDVVVNDIPPRNKFCAEWRLSYIHDDPEFWTNRYIAKYYGLRTIRIAQVKPSQKVQKVL